MARTTPSNVSNPTATVVHLLRLRYWTGAAENEILLTDASQDLDVDVGGGLETWTGDGLFLTISQVSENTDYLNQSIDISLDGVDQTIISAIMQNHFRGRLATLYRVWLDPVNGDVDGYIMIFQGYQNEPYNITATQTDSPDAVNVSTRCITVLTRLSNTKEIMSNEISHNEMIERDPNFAPYTNIDRFFRYTADLVNREIIWGDLKAGTIRGGKQAAEKFRGRRH